VKRGIEMLNEILPFEATLWIVGAENSSKVRLQRDFPFPHSVACKIITEK
jgi:hypothetical protein